MKKAVLFVVAVCVGMTLISSAAYARMGGGWGAGSSYGRLYSVQTVETVSGEVIKVEKIMPVKGMSYGIHIILKTATGDIDVHLGPAWYIDNQDVSVKKGDTVEVKGSKVTVGGKPAIIAAEVKKGDETLMLRDEAGFPYWSGWRRR